MAKVRYNRLIDIFLRVTAYSMQNHLRTAITTIGQMETDELYVAVRNTGEQFIKHILNWLRKIKLYTGIP